jgi:hypothetical protein
MFSVDEAIAAHHKTECIACCACQYFMKSHPGTLFKKEVRDVIYNVYLG